MGILATLFGGNKKNNALIQQNTSHYKLECEIKQQQEDLHVEMQMRSEVVRVFRQIEDSRALYNSYCLADPTFSERAGGFFFLRDWNKGIYTIYDSDTAKFKERGSLDKFREDYLRELQAG